MGLDVVDIVLQCEEDFEIELEDARLEQMRTVGDLFELVCEQLGLPLGPQETRPVHRVYIPISIPPNNGWSRDTVWSKLVSIVIDQLQVEPDEVKYSASFGGDLEAD